MPAKKPERKKLSVRLDHFVVEELQRVARENRRSVAGEVGYRLTQSLRTGQAFAQKDSLSA